MKKVSFSKNMERLDAIVAELESNPVELEKALQLFEEGIKLSARCQEDLDRASARISLLIRDMDGKVVLEDI